eukprot:TRINITY_DN6526_c0_g1_i1.p1 TRINITY_DN6526_c0_g1~~TRINITY_DN6526_c0_g1_i1.p1  ORF type:complete len:232 (-),score=50.14 TRINITY_DN6526_c0_g1_i1:54-749(-)
MMVSLAHSDVLRAFVLALIVSTAAPGFTDPPPSPPPTTSTGTTSTASSTGTTSTGPTGTASTATVYTFDAVRCDSSGSKFPSPYRNLTMPNFYCVNVTGVAEAYHNDTGLSYGLVSAPNVIYFNVPSGNYSTRNISLPSPVCSTFSMLVGSVYTYGAEVSVEAGSWTLNFTSDCQCPTFVESPFVCVERITITGYAPPTVANRCRPPDESRTVVFVTIDNLAIPADTTVAA